jgi:hypothetical protein
MLAVNRTCLRKERAEVVPCIRPEETSTWRRSLVGRAIR